MLPTSAVFLFTAGSVLFLHTCTTALGNGRTVSAIQCTDDVKEAVYLVTVCHRKRPFRQIGTSTTRNQPFRHRCFPCK